MANAPTPRTTRSAFSGRPGSPVTFVPTGPGASSPPRRPSTPETRTRVCTRIREAPLPSLCPTPSLSQCHRFRSSTHKSLENPLPSELAFRSSARPWCPAPPARPLQPAHHRNRHVHVDRSPPHRRYQARTTLPTTRPDSACRIPDHHQQQGLDRLTSMSCPRHTYAVVSPSPNSRPLPRFDHLSAPQSPVTATRLQRPHHHICCRMSHGSKSPPRLRPRPLRIRSADSPHQPRRDHLRFRFHVRAAPLPPCTSWHRSATAPAGRVPNSSCPPSSSPPITQFALAPAPRDTAPQGNPRRREHRTSIRPYEARPCHGCCNCVQEPRGEKPLVTASARATA